MSARRLPIRFAPEAREDVQDLLNYTRQQRGAQQRTAHREALNRAFMTLRAYPNIGKPRPDLVAGVRSFAVERHLMLYRNEDDAIRVLRVVHERMDATRLL